MLAYVLMLCWRAYKKSYSALPVFEARRTARSNAEQIPDFKAC
jgi:hypothetical protein